MSPRELHTSWQLWRVEHVQENMEIRRETEGNTGDGQMDVTLCLLPITISEAHYCGRSNDFGQL